MSTTRKVRYKKLSTKTALPVLREDQIDPNEYESLTSETQIATGVEQAEENEYHLQAVLHGPGDGKAENEIPVPPPQESKDFNYDEYYPNAFSKTINYIRFSDTLEECIGCTYDMTTEDEAFLKAYNQKRPPAAQLSEDDFERIMEVFEDTAAVQTPFAAVDSSVVPYDLMVHDLNQLGSTKILSHAKELYEYWKSRRKETGNMPLHPTLKFEMHQESDDMDPYVCFRRREVRQTRKTRARDVQSADKLKRLRRELEEGRQIIMLAQEREIMKRELLTTDRYIYEQRARLKEAKVRLGIKTDDEDLINQKPQKRKASDVPLVQRPPGQQLRISIRPGGAPSEPSDLVLLSDKLAEKENELRMDIETKIANHRKWNVNHVDLTREPLSPVKGRGIELSFRPAKTQYLMTPPASTSSESGDEESSAERVDGRGVARTPGGMFHFRPPSPPGAAPGTQVAFRRRIGRLNRLWIDRRGLSDRQPEPDQPYSDRWKYDQDDDDEQPEYELDPYGPESLAFRSNFQISPHLYPRRADSSGGHHGMNHAAAAAAAAQRQAALQAQATPQRSG